MQHEKVGEILLHYRSIGHVDKQSDNAIRNIHDQFVLLEISVIFLIRVRLVTLDPQAVPLQILVIHEYQPYEGIIIHRLDSGYADRRHSITISTYFANV